MSMSDHIKQQVVEEFFARKVLFSLKTVKLHPYNGYFKCPEFDVPRFETP